MKEEVMAPDWKNPMLKVKAPKVVLDPLEPISIQDVRALIKTCQRGDFIGERDRALFLFLLDVRAVMIRYGKDCKTRMVFIGGIAQELSNREISERLFLALDTVKGHNRRIYDKLQVQRRTEAVARACELGL
jgi:hypothetical protein